MRRWWLVAAVLAAVACGGDGETLRFGPEADGSTTTVAVGDTIEVALPANPSTGYAWEVVVFDASVLRPIGAPDFTAEADLEGAPGVSVFSFEVIGAGATTLDMIYRRSWESDPAAETFAMTLVAG